MTAPGGGGRGQDINLAALWIPVMPETSHMGEEMRKTGQEAKRQFEEGFNSGSSPEALGQNYSSKLMQSITQGLNKIELPYGLSSIGEKLGGDIDTKLVNKLKGEATDALRSYAKEYDTLVAAQTRATDAEVRLNTARQDGNTKASVMLPLMQENTRAQNELTTANSNAVSAYEGYANKQRTLNEAMSEGAAGGKLMAGIMGGVIVAGAQMAVQGLERVTEAVVEGIVESFRLGIETGEKFAETMVEIGEAYEHIGIQITEFSDASGEKFEELETHAQQVFSTLDVAGKNVGQTMAQFASMLDAEPGPALDRLTKHTTELQGRFTSLKTTDLASIFVAFKTPVDEADSALASLLQSARSSGQDIGQLTSALSGTAAITLQEAGLNLQQAGKFTAELMEMGAPGRQAMTGMSMAMKEFGKEGLGFSEGMKLAGERLKELGDTAEGQDLAQTLFGGRNWTVATQAVQNYMDILEEGPQAFDSNTASLEQFLTSTETLENKWALVKHRVEDAFAPMGKAALGLVGAGLDNMVTYVNEHMDRIKVLVRQGGDYIIGISADLQKFASGVLAFMAPVADGVSLFIQGITENMASMAIIEGHILELIPGMHDTGEGLVEAGEAARDMAAKLGEVKIGDKMRDLSEWVRDHQIDVEHTKDDWHDFWDEASGQNAPPMVGQGLLAQGNMFGAPANAGGYGPPGSPGGPPTFGGTTGSGDVTGSPDASGGGDQGLGGSQQANRALARKLFPWPESEWAAYERLEMAEAGFDATATNPKSGAFGMGQFYGHEHDKYAAGYSHDPATQLRTQFQYIADTYGTPSKAWAQYYQHKGGEGSYATGGPVYAQGGGDSKSLWQKYTSGEGIFDAKSLMPQVLQEAFKGRTPRYDTLAPLAESIISYPFAAAGSLVGSAQRGLSKVPRSASPVPIADLASQGDWAHDWSHPWDIPGRSTSWWPTSYYKQAGGSGPRGTDTVPAWLTPGEYVWDTGTVDKFGWLISALHGSAKHMQGGGPVDDVEGTNAQIHFVDEIAKGFGLQLTAGKSGHGTHEVGTGWHDTGAAGDFAGDTEHMLAFAMYMFEHYGSELSEIIFSDPRMTQLIKDGKSVDPQQVYGPWLSGHKNHVHIAVQPTSPMRDLSPGAESLSAGLPSAPSYDPTGATPGGKGGANYPGVPGQYGGGGAYGGQSADEAASAAKAVREANERKGQLDWEVGQAQKRIDALNDQIKNVGVSDKTGKLTGKPLPLTPDEQAAADEKLQTLQGQLDVATHDLATKKQEAADAVTDAADATRKQTESYYQKPTGAGTKPDKVGKAVGVEEFSQLGGALLGGIGESMGFGDLFGKPPWEWGAVKLLTGAANWAMGTANAWADQIGQGKTGIGGPGWGGNTGVAMPGWNQTGGSALSGVLGSMGIDIPKPHSVSNGSNISAGPNVVAGQPPGPFGPPTGPPPGPVSIDNSINVSSDVSDTKVLAPVKELQNSSNSSAFQFQGSLPTP